MNDKTELIQEVKALKAKIKNYESGLQVLCAGIIKVFPNAKEAVFELLEVLRNE